MRIEQGNITIDKKEVQNIIMEYFINLYCIKLKNNKKMMNL